MVMCFSSWLEHLPWTIQDLDDQMFSQVICRREKHPRMDSPASHVWVHCGVSYFDWKQMSAMKFRQLFWSASDWRPVKSFYTAASRWWWTKFQRRIWCEGIGSEAEMDQLKKLHPSNAMCFRCQWQRCQEECQPGTIDFGTRRRPYNIGTGQQSRSLV